MTVIPLTHNVPSDHFGTFCDKGLNICKFLENRLFHHIHNFFVVKTLEIRSILPVLFL